MRQQGSRRTTIALSVFLAVSGLIGVGAALAGASPSDAASDFTGHWATSNGVGFTITSEDASGGCTGTSDASGYGFVNCQVTGSAYAFDVTDGPSYTSHNDGTFDSAANTLSGSFNDGRGDNPYTGTRDSGGPTPTPSPSTTDTATPTPSQSSASPTASPTPGGPVTTTLLLICNTPADAGQTGTCTATVGGSGGTPTHPYPTGGVTMTAASGTLFGSTCTLAAAAGAGSAPSCTLQYLPPAGGLPAGTPVPVSAHYSGDSVFAASSAGTQLFGYAADPDSNQPLDVCQGTADCDGFDESVAQSLASDDGIIDFVASCPAGGSASPMMRLDTPAPDPQEASRLAQCIVQYNAATASSGANAPSLQNQTRAKFMLNNLIDMTNISVEQHTGGKAGEAYESRRDNRIIFQALQNLRKGDTADAAAEASTVITDLAAAAGDATGSSAGHLATDGAAAKPLDIKGALLAVIAKNPTAAQKRAFANAVALAAAKKPSATRNRARLTLTAARALGSIVLDGAFSKKGRLPAALTLGTTKATLKPGQVSKVRLTLTPRGQELLRVLSITPARRAATVQLTITQTRATAKRTGHATLKVTAS